MQIFLSWQQKFRPLIVITLAGLGLITATSFWASRQVHAALQDRDNATAFANASSALINHWLKLGILRKELTPASSEAFIARIDALEQLTGEMNQAVVAIEEISSTTGDIAEKIEEINLHTGQTKGLRFTLEQQTRGLSEQIQALSQSAQQLQIE